MPTILLKIEILQDFHIMSNQLHEISENHKSQLAKPNKMVDASNPACAFLSSAPAMKFYFNANIRIKLQKILLS